MLPFKTPVKAKDLHGQIYDPTYFVAMGSAKQNGVHLVRRAGRLQGRARVARELTFAEGKQLSNETNAQSNWGVNFANKIMVKCP